MHEDTHWVTVHATEETDVKRIVEQLTSITYEELPEDIKAKINYVSNEQIEDFKNKMIEEII